MRTLTRLAIGGALTAVTVLLCTGAAAALAPATGVDGGITPQAIDAPYEYLSTPSHKQINGYYCGPATCQIIDDYYGICASQESYARFLGTSRDGTIFPLVDDALAAYTGMSWSYHAGVTTATAFYTHVYRALEEKKRPMAIDIRIDPANMNYYTYFHAGHILPLEAFDWRAGRMIVRVNDPYNEADYHGGGGQTYGHKSYPRGQMATAVITSDRPDVIY